MRLISLLLLFACASVQASDEQKLAAAMDLQRTLAATDVPRVVDVVMQAIINQSNEELPAEVQTEMTALLTELATSEDYARAKAQVFATNFTLDELHQLTTLLSSPAYRRYQALLPALASDSAQQMNALMQANKSKIQQRLQAAWEKAGAR